MERDGLVSRLDRQVYRTRYRLVTWASCRPRVYFGARRMIGALDDLCIRRDTDIVIEGFPRSANSTTVREFLARQDRALHVAHHKHHAAQLLRATEWGIPAVVLIRKPRDACLSLLALAAETRKIAGRSRDRGATFSDVFAAYVAFYTAVAPCLDRLVIGQFEMVHRDLPGLIERTNTRFGTKFGTDVVEDVSQFELGRHAMPTSFRDGIKQDLRVRLEAEVASSAALRSLVAKAEHIYLRYEQANERHA